MDLIRRAPIGYWLTSVLQLTSSVLMNISRKSCTSGPVLSLHKRNIAQVASYFRQLVEHKSWIGNFANCHGIIDNLPLKKWDRVYMMILVKTLRWFCSLETTRYVVEGMHIWPWHILVTLLILITVIERSLCFRMIHIILYPLGEQKILLDHGLD